MLKLLVVWSNIFASFLHAFNLVYIKFMEEDEV